MSLDERKQTWELPALLSTGIVETVKENQLNPLNYLTYLFEHLPQIDLDDKEALDQVLPWSRTILEECRIPVKLKQRIQ